jgi:POLQ-like helicase
LDSNEKWLAMVWALFSDQSDDKFFHTVDPKSLPIQLASHWLQGNPYQVLFEQSSAEKGTKPWGTKKRRSLTEDEIVDFCESTLGFECSLILAAVAQFLFAENGIHEQGAEALNLFQKALKYGLPDWPSISCYEHGFADRVVAQRLCNVARAKGFVSKFFASALALHPEQIEAALKDYPSYFESVFAGRV